MIFGDMGSLKDLKRDIFMHKHILWDVEPKQLMEPRCRIGEEGKETKKNIHGYIFYIDKMAGMKPVLYLMCNTASGYAETIGKIDEIPDELIAEAIEENKDRVYFGMYPINKKIKDWLKRELGIKE